MKKIKELVGTIRVGLRTVNELRKFPGFKLGWVLSSKWRWHVITGGYQGDLGFLDLCKYLYKVRANKIVFK